MPPFLHSILKVAFHPKEIGDLIKRQSTVAGAAYQSGEKLFSEYDGKTKNYRYKALEVVCSEILLPLNAPKEYNDRQALWNAAEGFVLCSHSFMGQFKNHLSFLLACLCVFARNWPVMKVFSVAPLMFVKVTTMDPSSASNVQWVSTSV